MYCNSWMYKCYNMMSLLRDIKFVSRNRIFLSCDKSVDLTGVLSCRAALFECLRHFHLSLWQVPMMWRHKPDLLLLDHKQAWSTAFYNHSWDWRSIKQTCSRYIVKSIWRTLKQVKCRKTSENIRLHLKRRHPMMVFIIKSCDFVARG